MSTRWAFDTSEWSPTHADMLKATSCIQPEEKARLSKFVFKKDLVSSLMGRLLMRKFVHQQTARAYDSIKFLRDEQGKPYLEDNADINFNVSHQGNFVVLAGERSSRMLGVDVMKLEYAGGKSVGEFFRIMDRQFSPHEWRTIRNAGEEKNQIAMFYRHWCLKESYVKALGVGITISLRDISFKVNTLSLSKSSWVKDTELYVRGNKLGDWSFQEMLLDDDEHCVAVASNSEMIGDVLFQKLSFEEVMDGSVALLEPDQQYVGEFFRKMDKA